MGRGRARFEKRLRKKIKREARSHSIAVIKRLGDFKPGDHADAVFYGSPVDGPMWGLAYDSTGRMELLGSWDAPQREQQLPDHSADTVQIRRYDLHVQQPVEASGGAGVADDGGDAVPNGEAAGLDRNGVHTRQPGAVRWKTYRR